MIRIKGESNTATVRLVIFITVYLLFFVFFFSNIEAFFLTYEVNGSSTCSSHLIMSINVCLLIILDRGSSYVHVIIADILGAQTKVCVCFH